MFKGLGGYVYYAGTGWQGRYKSARRPPERDAAARKTCGFRGFMNSRCMHLQCVVKFRFGAFFRNLARTCFSPPQSFTNGAEQGLRDFHKRCHGLAAGSSRVARSRLESGFRVARAGGGCLQHACVSVMVRPQVYSA